MRERHVVQNMDVASEVSNPDTTNSAVWMMGSQPNPSPVPSKRECFVQTLRVLSRTLWERYRPVH